MPAKVSVLICVLCLFALSAFYQFFLCADLKKDWTNTCECTLYPVLAPLSVGWWSPVNEPLSGWGEKEEKREREGGKDGAAWVEYIIKLKNSSELSVGMEVLCSLPSQMNSIK